MVHLIAGMTSLFINSLASKVFMSLFLMSIFLFQLDLAKIVLRILRQGPPRVVNDDKLNSLIVKYMHKSMEFPNEACNDRLNYSLYYSLVR